MLKLNLIEPCAIVYGTPMARSTWDGWSEPCLLYTSDAADDLLCVDLGGRRIIKKKTSIPELLPSIIVPKQDHIELYLTNEPASYLSIIHLSLGLACP